MSRTTFVSWLSIVVLASVSLIGQSTPACDVTCSPDPTSPNYSSVVAARPKLLNARGFSSPIQAKSGPGIAPMIIGSQSYNYVIPILSLPGRAGMDLNLNLYYNSRIWDVDTIHATVTFNADRDFPSYGFRLDFGYLEYDPNNDQYILTERDGTKRALPNNGGYNSIDGSFISYQPTTGVLTYKNGMMAQFSTFQSPNNLYYPSTIKDTNGNFISIAYVRGHPQLIQAITDTLGRVINFHYDANNQLSYIDQDVAISPVDPTGVHRYVTFTWASLYGGTYHWHNFMGLTVNGAPDFNTALNVLTGCTYTNGTGYRFTYGDWGIVNKIERLSASSSPIVTRSYVSYNFPSASVAQTDAPTYTQETISQDGQNTSSFWTYEATKLGTGSVTSMKVTEPLIAGASKITVTNVDPVTGLTSSVQVQDNSGKVLRTMGYSWTTSGGANVPSSLTTTLNDTGQQSSVQYSNYDAFGNAADINEFDFGGQLLRHTVLTYATGAYVTQHILGLPTQILIKDGSGTIVGRTDIAYDIYGTSNPMASITGAGGHDDFSYGTSFTTRGNVTSTTRYSNAAAGSGAVTRGTSYDTLGNIRVAQLDCCIQRVFNFPSSNHYAYPTSVIRGPSGLQFTTSATFNNDKGLVTSITDENNQVTQYEYDSVNRITKVTIPPQGSTSVQFITGYDDLAASPTVTTSSTANSVVNVTTTDGLGHALQVDSKNCPIGQPTCPTVVRSMKNSYDKLWRINQTSNPYDPGETPIYTSYSYDPLGRTIQISAPSGGSASFDYSGNAVTAKDQAGKQRKSYTDALGRLTQVDEPGVISDHIPANNYLKLQSGGNAVLFDPYNNPLWSTGTTGTNYGPLELQDDGNLVLYQFKWQAGTYRVWNGGHLPYDGCFISDSLFVGQVLHENQCLENMSNSTFALMTNGDLEIYDRQLGQITWKSNTYGNPGAYLTMQSDGNLVIYSSSGVALWSSGTSGSGANVATLENDGRIILYSTVWNSGTSQGLVSGSLAAPSCNLGSGLGSTGTMGTGQCLVSRNGHFQLLLQSDGNLVLSKIDVTPAQVLWSTDTALTPLSLDVAFHTTYSYDPRGNLTGVSQAAIPGQASGQARSYAYDGLGRLTSDSTPKSGTITRYYTDSSNGPCAGDPLLICRMLDARGVVKSFSYDDINRLVGIQYTGDPTNTPQVAFQYDSGGAATFALNRLTSITEGPNTPIPANSHSFTYDNLGRITKDVQSIDQRTYTLQYVYNLAGEITSTTYPSGRVVVRTYDAIGRPCSVGSAGSTCTSGSTFLNNLTYNAAGETLGLTLGNNVQGMFTYNDHLQLTSMRYFKSGTSPDILNLSYDYTSAAQPANNGTVQAIHYFTQPGVEDQTKSESFKYDQLGRLSAAQTLTVNGTAGTWSLQWAYDRFGNRLSQSLVGGNVSIGQPNVLVDVTTNRITGFCYDAAGNLRDQAACPSGSHQYSYDGANRLTNTATATYTYFGSRRIKKVAGSTTTRYIYSGAKPIAEYVNGATSPSTEYIYAGSRLLVTISGSTTIYHHPDHLSNRAETDSSGTRGRTYGHFPFGETWYETGTADKWKFTDYENDSESGLNYAGARFQSSGFGRFMSPDPLHGNFRNPQSLNRYAYVGNDPINTIDPSGMEGEDDTPCGPFESCGGNDTDLPDDSLELDLSVTGDDWLSVGMGMGMSDEDLANLIGFCGVCPGGLPFPGMFDSPSIDSPGLDPDSINGHNDISTLSIGGFGIVGGGSAGLGEGMGLAGTGTLGAGYFRDNGLTGFGSFGAFAGGANQGWSYPGKPEHGINGVYGMFAGLGAGPFVTNATSKDQFKDEFDVTVFNFALGEYQFASSGPIWSQSLTFGPGYGFGYAHFTTNTWVDNGPGRFTPPQDDDPAQLNDPCAWGACQ